MLDVTVMLTVYSIRTKSERKPDLKSSTRKEPRALSFLLRLGNGRRGRREACVISGGTYGRLRSWADIPTRIRLPNYGTS